MNREIKYQAWYKKENRMIYPVIQLHLDNMPFIGWYETVQDAVEGKLTTAFLDEVELREYIGRKDKNGKEIYEGDIDGSDEPMFVAYEDGSFGLKYSEKSDYFNSCISWDRCEIIGNIYENPDLLEG
jgi:YopX protein.